MKTRSLASKLTSANWFASRRTHVLDGCEYVPPKEKRQAPVEAGICSTDGRATQGTKGGVIRPKKVVCVFDAEVRRWAALSVGSLIDGGEVVWRVGRTIPPVTHWYARVGEEKPVRAAINKALWITGAVEHCGEVSGIVAGIRHGVHRGIT